MKYANMYHFIQAKIDKLYNTNVPATGIGLFRVFFGLVTLQEIFFLLYFNHLIFDPIPYLDVEFPMIPFFLCLWALVASLLTLGYHSQPAVIANYLFWIVFVSFTPMQRDFDGGFDSFMIGTNLFMIFMPIEKSFSIDLLKNKLKNPFKHYSLYPQQKVSILAYYIPITISLGFLYFDSAIHKMFAEHWRNGLGAWLPATIPYYISNINMSRLLDNEILQKTIGYTILFFQFTFIFLFHTRAFKTLYWLIGLALHIGIILTLNIFPFGLGMLIFYILLMPFSWYQKASLFFAKKSPALTVFYDDQCPLCSRTILIINHFDIFSCIDFKSAQKYQLQYPAISNIKTSTLILDLYALDANNSLYCGVNTYAEILIKMRYPLIIGYCLKTPGIYQLACKIYRRIADSRHRMTCNESCEPIIQPEVPLTLYDKIFNPLSTLAKKHNSIRISKLLILILILQINSSIHYGLIYRLGLNTKTNSLTSFSADVSNILTLFSTTFIGITPHALYLHDHFAGYNHLIAITFIDSQGKEQWLPFITSDGRFKAPNWGRVHSMWANIAVTPDIDTQRLSKFIMKTTAFWGTKAALDLNSTVFNIKLKKISAPSYWVKNQLNSNLSGHWVTIGNATWHKQSINLNIPDNINIM